MIIDRLAEGALPAAPALLGCRLVTKFGVRTVLEITEVEAYGGADDPASHAYRGRTPRNQSMFGPPGTLYVYRSYGIHWCANIATGPEGVGQAVLIRGGLVVEGEQEVIKRRGRSDHLADGPGKLTTALGITGTHDCTSVFTGPVKLETGCPPDPSLVRSGPRVGISRAVDLPWRFWVSRR